MTSTNPLTSYFSSYVSGSGTTTSTSSTSTGSTSSTTSAQIAAQVEAILSKQNTVAPKINAQLTVDQTKLSALGQLQSALAAFQSVAQSMSGGGLSASASSSVSGVLTASSSASAVAGSYAVSVSQLASSQVLTTAAQSSETAAIGTGAATTIKIDFGTTSGSSFSASGKSASIVINSANNSLDGIATAINNANAGVTATVVKGASGYSLSLTSPTGAASSMRIGVTGDSSLQSLLAYNPAGSKKMSASASAQDALLTVNGKAVSSASNTVTTGITGASLTLKSTGSSTVTVAQDSSQIASNISSLVNAYNTLNDKLTSLKQGDLKTNNAVRNIQSQLAAIFPFGAANGDSGTTLSTLGITRQGNGDLTLDSSKLQAAVTANADGVSKFFTNGSSGVADKLVSALGVVTGAGGSVKQAISTVNADITSLTAKKATVQAAMTAKGNALMKFYTDQANGTSTTSSILNGISSTSSGTGTLFDML